MKRRLFLVLLALMLMSTSTLGMAFADSKLMSFSDINDTFWAKPNIDVLVEKGGISGYPDGTFKPNKTITASEFIKIALYLIPNVEVESASGAEWYKPYVSKAKKIGIVPDGMFTDNDWNKPINRQKMAVISVKVAMELGEDMNIENRASYSGKFKDYSSICQYCREYVIDAVAKGIVGGYPDGTFKPENSATRAEATAMLVRVIDPAQRLAAGTTEDVACNDRITYKVGDQVYEARYEEHTLAELGIAKINYSNGFMCVYSTVVHSPFFTKSDNSFLVKNAVLNVTTNLDYVKKDGYYVYGIRMVKDVYEEVKKNYPDFYFMVYGEATVNTVYFPEETAVRIVDLADAFEN